MMGTLQLNSGSIMLVFLVLYGLHRLISFLWWRPKRTQKLFRSQGIKGPSYKLLLGNLKDLAQIKQQHKSQTQKGVATSKHDIVSGIMPHINVWRKKYGLYLPTPFNRKYKRLNKEGDRLFKELIEGQDIGLSQQYGILELMLSENRKAKSMSTQDIIDECKTFFAAGYSTTSLLLSWATMLLGMYTEWQERAREEVRDVLDGGPPTFENLNRLKTTQNSMKTSQQNLNLVRLYSPATLTMRKANEETKLGNLTVPAGTVVEVPIIAIHHEPEQWGDDVHQFNPGRFKDGVSKASKHPMAFMPFGHGPTMCMGMNFAMIESKSALAIILQNFSFVISPTYKHSPQCGVTLGPEHGVHIILSKI
ncbi:hypothetical protein AMTRI_Chr10g226840 [Amborella trichopoda]